MCNLLSGRDQVPLAVCSSKWAPHPSFEASVKICRACFRGCNGWPRSTLLSSSHHLRWGWRDLGTGITFSSDSGTLQLFFMCHCMGLMWSRPKWTCFSVAMSRPMRDMNCRTGQTGSDSMDLPTFFCWSDPALFQVELVTYKVEDLFGDQFWLFLVHQPP